VRTSVKQAANAIPIVEQVLMSISVQGNGSLGIHALLISFA
jgi:hypothetical protein